MRRERYDWNNTANAAAASLWASYITLGVTLGIVSPWWYLAALPSIIGAGIGRVRQ